MPTRLSSRQPLRLEYLLSPQPHNRCRHAKSGLSLRAQVCACRGNDSFGRMPVSHSCGPLSRARSTMPFAQQTAATSRMPRSLGRMPPARGRAEVSFKTHFWAAALRNATDNGRQRLDERRILGERNGIESDGERMLTVRNREIPKGRKREGILPYRFLSRYRPFASFAIITTVINHKEHQEHKEKQRSLCPSCPSWLIPLRPCQCAYSSGWSMNQFQAVAAMPSRWQKQGCRIVRPAHPGNTGPNEQFPSCDPSPWEPCTRTQLSPGCSTHCRGSNAALL